LEVQEGSVSSPTAEVRRRKYEEVRILLFSFSLDVNPTKDFFPKVSQSHSEVCNE
jgi:hypothetical protein